MTLLKLVMIDRRHLLALLIAASLASSSAAARPRNKVPKDKPAAAQADKPDRDVVERPGDGPVDPRASSSVDAGGDAGARRGPSRIEFDERLVKGQTNKANAVYLFERRESALRSLLRKRVDFDAEIDEMLE